jgi:hypothetical protein
MIETITPAVCGSRRRRRIALIIFALAAVASAALVGVALGTLGLLLGGTAAIAAAAVIAGLAALRELGVVRFPLPQSRRQVPQWWHARLPLPVWSAGYGAGLGAGFFTFQPVATFWVACAAAVALGRPLAAGACFALYGVGRALMVVVPARREPEVTAAVERLARLRPALVRANGLVLAACAVALAVAPAAGAGGMRLGPTGLNLDPTASEKVFAHTSGAKTDAQVIVRPPGAPPIPFAGSSPSLHGGLLAYEEGPDVRIVRWATGEEVARMPDASKPQLRWPWLAFRRDMDGGRKYLRLKNMTTGQARLVARVGPKADLGRPALHRGRLAWHTAGPKGSRVFLYGLDSRRKRIVVQTKIALLANPALGGPHIAWTEQRRTGSKLFVKRIGTKRIRQIARTKQGNRVFWTTALDNDFAYVTRWFVPERTARINKIRL